MVNLLKSSQKVKILKFYLLQKPNKKKEMRSQKIKQKLKINKKVN